MEAIATFNFRDREIDPIRVQCKADEKFSLIYEKLAKKIYINSNDFDFYYNENIINKDSTIIRIKNNKSARNIDISVKKKSKVMKCPKCICNNSIIKMENYRVKFSECCHHHQETIIFDEYENSQKIDYTKIACHTNGCKKVQSKNLEDFYKCLECSQLIGYAIYYCKKCNENHIETDKHKTIKYDEKYYYCTDHFNKFISFCKNCKENLCKDCEAEHKQGHEIKKFDAINLDVQPIKKDLEEIRQKTRDLKLIVNQIKNLLDGAVSIIEKYYTIAEDLITKYESYNKTLKNFQVIESIEYLSVSNKEIMYDLQNIIKGKKSKENWIKKCKILIGIQEGDREFYKGENSQFENEFDDNYINEKNKEYDTINTEGNNFQNGNHE